MGNFSRDTFDRLKHYVGVRLQQGVPIVDADWNELEDIRRYELQAFLNWFVGNGVPDGNDGFNIEAVGDPNDLLIRGGDGTAEGAGRLLIEGLDVLNESDMRYTAQPLYNNPALAAEWGVDPIPPLTTPAGNRSDLIYIDVWEREVDSTEDPNLINPAIGVETCVRIKREWAVRTLENTSSLPAAVPAHVFYPLAQINRIGGSPTILSRQISDRRQKNINLANLVSEIAAARGTAGSLDARLDVALAGNGQLNANIVGNSHIRTDAAIAENKVRFNGSGHDHSGGANGQLIDTSGLANNAVTSSKINFETVNSGSEADIPSGSTRRVLVEQNSEPGKKIYLPSIAVTNVGGSGLAQVTYNLIYLRTSASSKYDVYLLINHLEAAGGNSTAEVDVIWAVYTFGQLGGPIQLERPIQLEGPIELGGPITELSS